MICDHYWRPWHAWGRWRNISIRLVVDGRPVGRSTGQMRVCRRCGREKVRSDV